MGNRVSSGNSERKNGGKGLVESGYSSEATSSKSTTPESKEPDPEVPALPQQPPQRTSAENQITAGELYNAMMADRGQPYLHNPDYLLLIDLRPPALYHDLHVVTAVPAAQLPAQVEVHLGEFTYVVLYDQQGGGGEGLPPDQLQALLDRLAARGCEAQLLVGGFAEFSSRYAFLCTQKTVFTQAQRKAAIHSYPSEVLEGALYQGTGVQATTEQVISDLGITHVVNVTTEYSNAFADRVRYLNVRISDEVSSWLLTQLPATSEFIQQALTEGGRVLVHCVLGVSRSSTVTMAYLMRYRHWSLQDAYEYLKERRAVVSPNRGFLLQLSTYEEKLFGKKLSSVDEIWF